MHGGPPGTMVRRGHRLPWTHALCLAQRRRSAHFTEEHGNATYPCHAGRAEQLCPTHTSGHAKSVCFPPTATYLTVSEAGGTVSFSMILKYKSNNAHLKKIKDTKKETSHCWGRTYSCKRPKLSFWPNINMTHKLWSKTSLRKMWVCIVIFTYRDKWTAPKNSQMS